ncbi:MAG TPA: S8 family serine peptidase [Pyrinomonadaceae bacterium]
MRRFLTFAAVAVLAAVLLALPIFVSNAGSATPVTVIVELKDAPGAVYAAKAKQQGAAISDDQMLAYRNGLTATQNKFLSDLSARVPTAQVQSVTLNNVTFQLRYTLVYNGLAVTLPSSAIPVVKAMPQVKGVHPNTRFFTTLDHSVPYTRAPEVYGQVPELTQFDDRREGYEGQGMYISIIDTGIDWTHPMFGGDPTAPRLGVSPVSASVPTNPKVVYYLPLTDIAVNDGFGHGTHVASTAAGYQAFAPGADGLPNTADDIAIHGMAPQAKLMSYKVCSDVQSTVSSLAAPIGGCDTSNIIMAIEDSVSPRTVTGFAKPVAHVINMSLGGGGGPDEPTAVASDNATLTGCTVVAAAGNSGPAESTLGAPAAGSRVIAVAANTDPGSHLNWSVDVLQSSAVPASQTGSVSPANNLPTQSGFGRLKLYSQAGTPLPPAAAMAQYYALVDDPLVVWPASVSGRIALIKNSGLASGTFFDICQQAVNAGAVGMLLDSDVDNPTAVKCSIPAANIMPADADVLINAIGGAGTPANGALSQFPIRINPDFRYPFVGDTTNFSSRGPVQGYGQVKPDVSAPGANILAAMPPASLLGALSQGNYGAISGTSMACPHTAGAAALLRQAHPDWTPDQVRTALINTATNMRDESHTAKIGGLDTESVNDQGGGLIDVYHAVNAKALMGVAGDGVTTPGILGSYSYGEVPVVNSRINYTTPVTVTIRDLSGEGGTYNLSTTNSRDLQLSGVGSSLSAASVTVPANGSATFTVNASVDGDAIRSIMAAKVNGSQVTFEPIQMQWYVTATRADGKQTLRMPFYLKPSASLPANPVTTDQLFEGVMPASGAGEVLQDGVTSIDIPFQVNAGTYRVDARLDYLAQNVEDMDFYLYGPDGSEVTHSAISGGPEQFSTGVTQPGTYKYRIVGFANGPVTYTVTGKLFSGPAAPVLQAVAGNFVDNQGRQVDFDGNFTLSWQAEGHERGFEVERSTDNGETWSVIATPTTASLDLTGQPSGALQYRVRGLQDGRIGYYVTGASNAISVVVDPRSKVDITSQISRAISNVSLTGGVFQLDVAITNNSSQTYVPFVEFNVVGVNSGTGTVKVINADNAQDGKSLATAALFGYSDKLGADQQFAPTEVSGTRTFRFQDSASELFTFDAVVTAYISGSPGGRGGVVTGSTTSGGSTTGGSSGSTGVLSQVKAVVRFTANPLTKTVSTQIVNLK